MISILHFTDKSADSLSNQSQSSSRSNFEVEMTKEKVKIKIVSVKSDTNSVKTASSTESSGHPSNSSPASTSPRSMSASKNDSVQPPAKSKFHLSKEKDVKVKSATSAEAEYDFDQHLLEEKLTEKNQFLKSIHLAPRTAAEMQATKSPSKTEPKNDQPTDLSKDVKPSTPSVTASSAPPTKNSASASTSPPTTRTTSPQTHTHIHVDRETLRRPENKASKRKSREPVKNVTKLKCPPPTPSGSDSHWPPSAAASSNNGGSRSLSSPASPSLLPLSTHLHNDRDRLSDAAMQTALLMSTQNKNNLKQQQHHHQQRQTPFKTPMASESSSSSGKDPKKSSESETSIIINNVQRPNQADTPRPTMAFNSNLNLNSYLLQRHQLFNETEIKEIRNDDAKKVKVYGPPNPSYQHMKPVAGSKRNYNQSNQNEPLHMNAPAYSQEFEKKLKSQMGHGSSTSSGSPGPIDMKKKLNSTGELVVTTSSSSKTNATPKRQSEPGSDSVHTLLQNCNITLPSSLSVTLTHDEMESDRSFNQKKTPVTNSIQIVKLPDESSTSPADQSRYTKCQSSSPSLHSRSENNHSGSASPVAINLVNNKSSSSTHSQNATKQQSSNSPVPGPSNTASDFQAHFIQSFAKHQTLQKKKKIKPNSMLAPAYPTSRLNRSPPKRMPHFNGPRASMQLPSRIPARSPARKLLSPKIDSPLIGMPSAPSVSELFSQLGPSSMPERLLQPNSFANYQSGGSLSGGGSSIPTSQEPIWLGYAPKMHISAHVLLKEHLHKTKSFSS